MVHRPIKVLLVSDEAHRAFIVRAAMGLSDRRFELDCRADCLEAVDGLQAARRRPGSARPDVIVVDLGSAGPGSLKTLRDACGEADVPIVALAGNDAQWLKSVARDSRARLIPLSGELTDLHDAIFQADSLILSTRPALQAA
ncbi:MAG: ANTAR domain-containing protein [Planctomycetota bacterium]|jgi:DNA-binding response OmpR family regulator